MRLPTVNLTELAPQRVLLRAENPLTTKESLHLFGTVTFSSEFIRGQLTLERGVLQADTWMSFVPECFRTGAAEELQRIFEAFEGLPADDRLLDGFAAYLSARLRQRFAQERK